MMMRRLALLRWLCAIVVGAGIIIAEECSPAAYLVAGGQIFNLSSGPPAGASAIAYCFAQHYGGGSCSGGSYGWTWSGSCVYHTALSDSRGCDPCDSVGCQNGYCRCVSAFDNDIPMCYGATAPCLPCTSPSATPSATATAKAQYRLGCGCGDCRTIGLDHDGAAARAAFYANADFFSMINKCTDASEQYGYVCGPGVCKDCPVGYYCPDDLNAYPCPPFYYQDGTSPRQCQECDVTHYGDYVPLGQVCDPVHGFTGNFASHCDQCTPASLLDGIGDSRKACPPQDTTYGRYQNGSCLPCGVCTGTQYARPTAAEGHCVTDAVGSTQCRERYNNATNTAGYHCTDGGGCAAPNEQEALGAMPWRAGAQRTLSPWRYRPGTSYGGLLPYYADCPPVSFDEAQRFRPRLSAQATMNGGDWRDDCDRETARECMPGYYAVLSPVPSARNGLPALMDCRACGAHGRSAGGLQTDCTCDAGFANWGMLDAKLAQLAAPAGPWGPDSAQTCVACETDVSFVAPSDGLRRTEALACNGTFFNRCVGVLDYVDRSLPAVCSLCNGGALTEVCASGAGAGGAGIIQIPWRNRTGCRVCPPGQSIVPQGDGFDCADCPAGEYQPLAGQCACLPKRTTCPPGFYVARSTAAEQLNRVADYACLPCLSACPAGQLTIAAPPSLTGGSTNNNTCNGAGGYYFACFDDTWAEGLGPTLRAGERLVFPNAVDAAGVPPAAHIAQCPFDPYLPKDLAAWVALTQVGAAGFECYFACRHGVNPTAAARYQTLIAAYVHANRTDLVPFLLTADSPAPWGAPPSGVTTVVIPSLWMQPGVSATTQPDPSLNDDTWTVVDPWTVTAAGVGDVRLNTFLFDDGFLDALPEARALARSQMCLTPAQAYVWACPSGVVTLSSSSGDPGAASNNCALGARTRAVRIRSQQTNATAVAVLAASTPAGAATAYADCIAPDTQLTLFRVGCTVACLDLRLRDAYHLAHLEPPSNYPWYDRFAWAAYFLQPSTWIALRNAFNPYGLADFAPASGVLLLANNASNSSSGACRTTCAPLTFRYAPGTAHAGDGAAAYVQLNAAARLAALYACVPCDDALVKGYGDHICGLFVPPRYFMNSVCVGGAPANATELTTDHVCSKCATTVEGGTLIALSASDYTTWWDVRRTDGTAYFTDLVNGAQPWNDGVTCRYRCAAGYTSNNLSPDAYNARPCVPCASLASPCPPPPLAVAMYVNHPSVTCDASGFVPYRPTCDTCERAYAGQTSAASNSEPKYNFSRFDAAAPVDTPLQCLALCNNKYYQSYDLRAQANAPPVTAPVPIADLKCNPCLTERAYACGGAGCTAGYYYAGGAVNGSGGAAALACAPCNTSRCAADGFYRQTCPGGFAIADAACVPCPASALTGADGAQRRRYLSAAELAAASPDTPWVAAVASPHPDQCPLVCVNNYAWLNASSSRSPFFAGAAGAFAGASGAARFFAGGVQLTGALECVACATLAAASGGEPLFSMWTARNTTPGTAIDAARAAPALASMAGLLGGCYPCPGGGIRDVIATSTAMCELLPGFTDDWQLTATQSVSVTLNVPGASALGLLGGQNTLQLAVTVGSRPPSAVGHLGDTGGGRRRRLLLLPAASDDGTGMGRLVASSSDSAVVMGVAALPRVVQTVPAVRPPVFRPGGGYFACCDAAESNPAAAAQCRALQGSTRFYGLGALTGPRVRGPCAALAAAGGGGQRRLLQTTGVEEGGGSWLANGTGTPPSETCAIGAYKPDRGNGACSLCPLGASTTGAGVGTRDGCVCQPGYYNRADGGLLLCGACPNGTFNSGANASACTPCPAGQFTPGPAATGCTCLPGTYRIVYNDGSSECAPCAAGFYCRDDTAAACPPFSVSPDGAASLADCACDLAHGYYGDPSLGSCRLRPPGTACAGGADSCACAPGWRVRTQTLPGGDVFLRCDSVCGPGTFPLMQARTQALLACVLCPVDTYAVDGSLVVDGCTPCPPGRSTAGRTGMTSVDNCTCAAAAAAGTGARNNASTTTPDYCAGCAAGFYFDYLHSKQCRACPAGWSSAPNTVGALGCLCPPGHYAAGAACAPCPLGTFARALGLTCTPCPQGCTTDAPGQTSVSACRCVRAPL